MRSDQQNTGCPAHDALTEAEHKAIAWAGELMGDCQGRDTLNALSDELQRLRRLKDCVPDDVAAQARVIGLYLKPFCEGSLPYYEMIAEASRRAAAHIKALEEQSQQLTTEHGAMKRRIVGRPDLRCMKCGHYACGSGQWSCPTCGEWHMWESVGDHNWHPESEQGKAWLEPVAARFDAWLHQAAALERLNKEAGANG